MDRKGIDISPVLLNVGYSQHVGDWNYKDVLSPFARIHYVKRGTAKILRADRIVEMSEGHMYYTPPYVRHSYSNDCELELYYLHIYFDNSSGSGLFEMNDIRPEGKCEPGDMQLFERLAALNPMTSLKNFDPKVYDNEQTFSINIAGSHKNSLAAELETDGIIRQLLSRFLAGAVDIRMRIDPRIARTIQFIDTHIEERLGVDQLSEEAALSKDHFIRLFNKEMHITPGKFVNRKKIEAAQLRIVLDSNASIKDIAYGLGFDNPQYFNKLFLKICGITPGSYRSRCLMKEL